MATISPQNPLSLGPAIRNARFLDAPGRGPGLTRKIADGTPSYRYALTYFSKRGPPCACRYVCRLSVAGSSSHPVSGTRRMVCARGNRDALLRAKSRLIVTSVSEAAS